MSSIVYRLAALVESRVANVPVGMNLGLFHLLSALLSGHFLLSRGAVWPALAAGGVPVSALPWAGAALAYGRWSIQTLVQTWHRVVQQEGWGHAHCYEGFRLVAWALVDCFRLPLHGCVATHSQAAADKARPPIVLAVVAAVGAVGTIRLPLGRWLLRAEPEKRSDAMLQRRVVKQVGATLAAQVLVVATGNPVATLLQFVLATL